MKIQARHTDWEDLVIDLEDLQQVDPGNAVALRTTNDELGMIVTGQVRWVSETNPETKITEAWAEGDGTPSPASVSFITIDPELWWALTDGEVTDRSDRIEDVPSVRPATDDPKNPALWRITYRKDGRITLTLPEARGTPTGEIVYGPIQAGTIVDVESGDVVDPQHLVPEHYRLD